MFLSFSNYLNKVFIFFIKKNKIDRLATKEWSYFVSSEIKKISQIVIVNFLDMKVRNQN